MTVKEPPIRSSRFSHHLLTHTQKKLLGPSNSSEASRLFCFHISTCGISGRPCSTNCFHVWVLGQWRLQRRPAGTSRKCLRPQKRRHQHWGEYIMTSSFFNYSSKENLFESYSIFPPWNLSASLHASSSKTNVFRLLQKTRSNQNLTLPPLRRTRFHAVNMSRTVGRSNQWKRCLTTGGRLWTPGPHGGEEVGGKPLVLSSRR